MTQKKIDEATVAAASLVPKNASKTELLSHMLKTIGGLKKEDLSKILDIVLSQVGKEDEVVGDVATANKNSIAAQSPTGVEISSTMREDVNSLFEESEDLSEEFKTRAANLFEAAVNNRVILETARLTEELEEAYEQKLNESIDEIVEQNSKYMDYVANEWMKKNEVAIENNFRVEHTEKFIKGLIQLFRENYVDVPEDKVDMIGELESTVASLKEQLNAVLAENLELKTSIAESHRERLFNEIAEGLTDTQVERLKKLTEGIDYIDDDNYRERINIIKNKYFTETADGKNGTGLINEEETIGMNEDNGKPKFVDPVMARYLSAISRTKV